MKRKISAATTALSLLAAAPAYAHHEYSSNEGLLSLVSGTPLAVLALGLTAFVAVRLLARRSSR
ncbi:MAG: hypothetical protein AAFY34_01705 [Pseudomonadota bacterium]